MTNFTEAPEDILKNIYSHLSAEEIAKSIILLNKNTSVVMGKLYKDQGFWKMLVEKVIGVSIPYGPENWEEIHNTIKIGKTNKNTSQLLIKISIVTS